MCTFISPLTCISLERLQRKSQYMYAKLNIFEGSVDVTFCGFADLKYIMPKYSKMGVNIFTRYQISKYQK